MLVEEWEMYRRKLLAKINGLKRRIASGSIVKICADLEYDQRFFISPDRHNYNFA